MREKFLFYFRHFRHFLFLSFIVYGGLGQLGAIAQAVALAALFTWYLKPLVKRILAAMYDDEPDEDAEERTPFSDEVLRMIAIHEAGHAVAAWILPGASKPMSISIIPDFNSNGKVSNKELPGYMDMDAAIDDIAVRYAGTAAEQEFGGTHGNGASDDIAGATSRATEMVCQFGFSDKLPKRTYYPDKEQLTDEIISTINSEIDRFLRLGEARAVKTVKAHREKVAHVASILLKEKKLDEEGLREAIETAQAA